ncbi:hypothetical protein FOYG_04018 [Fusarium oxysporum NRRL 32931]|uniref:mannan endo-1,4-beta-mannosidase n=1 Tax=Fusarium oxysporum NRRL 32931 TaxID=660029 RepID=W9ING7_FUSOX|nr:hypothetical protein FOYG_04018 [Fusarium oxysporum NRRL 32931]
MRVFTSLSLFALAAASAVKGRPKQREVAPVFNIDGKNQYLAGTNTWWMSHLTSDDDVEQAMSQIADSGLKVTRVWAFGNTNTGADQPVYFQFLDTTKKTITINNGTNGIARLDAAVAAAEKHGIQLVLPMLNNWDDLGGINTYCAYFGCTHENFWTHVEAQKAYRDYVTFIVNRYKDSPAIFSWQLCNEPRCQNCETSVITSWATELSSFIKSLDPKHRVSLGDEGWLCSDDTSLGYAYSCSEGIDFEANLKISTLDYGTVHMYPIGWGYTYPWGNQWIRDHAALALKYGKPIVLEEYGVESTTSNRTAVLQQWQQTIIDSDIAYDSFWQFGTNLPSGANPYDDYAMFYGTQEYQDVVIDHAQAISKKAVSTAARRRASSRRPN